MSELPGGWTTAPISAVADLVRGVTYKKADASSTPVEGYLPIIRATNINGRLSLGSEMVFVPARYVRREQRLEVGDIVVATSSGSASVVGKSAPLNQTWEGGFGAFCMVIRPSPELAPGYLAHLVAGPGVRKHWRELAQGININNLKSSDLANTVVALPPTEEQARIVAAIEEQFSRLDVGMAALERIRHNLKRMRAAVLDAAVPSADGSTTPKVRLADLVAPGRKIAYGVLVPGGHDPNGVPLVRVGDLSNRQVSIQDLKRIDPAIAARYPRTQLQGGEVLLSLVGTIGRTAVVLPELAGANTARALAVIPVQETVEPRYVAIALSRDRVTLELTQLSHEVARKTLNLEDVRRYEIPLPTYAEQLEIVMAVETQETWIKSIEEVVGRTFRRGEHLRSSILEAAFSGRMLPQDESDEPASALLARITSEQLSVNGNRLSRGRKPRARQEKVRV